MTIAELERAVDSKRRVIEAQNKEKAIYDYILAQLVGNSVARMYSSEIAFPTLGESYPGLFGEEMAAAEEATIATKDELSALRFIQFANSYNNKFKE
jgi:hypothetical protein